MGCTKGAAALQRHGDVIEGMSGWAHACWKMAFDYLLISTMPEIAFMQRMRGAQLIGRRSAEDDHNLIATHI